MKWLAPFRVACIFAVVALLLTGWATTTPATAATQTYEVVDLGSISIPLTPELAADPNCVWAGNGSVTAIGDDGSVIGASPKSNFYKTPIVIVDGTTTRLKSGGISAYPSAVSADGTVIGYIFKAEPDDVCHFTFSLGPATWTDGVLKELPLPDGFEGALTSDVNTSGTIVGTGFTAGFASQVALMWSSEGVTALETLPCETGPGVTSAMAINDSGVIVGSSGCNSAVMWVDGKVSELPSLGDAAGAIEINDAGVIVGRATVPGIATTSPAIWVDGEISLLPTPSEASSGWAMDLNEDGVVIGQVDNEPVAWIDGEFTKLADAIEGEFSGDLIMAGGVNESGQIAGTANVGNEVHAILLNPVG